MYQFHSTRTDCVIYKDHLFDFAFQQAAVAIMTGRISHPDLRALFIRTPILFIVS